MEVKCKHFEEDQANGGNSARTWVTVRIPSLHRTDEERQQISLGTWDALEQLGVTASMKQLHRKSATLAEIQNTIVYTMVGVNMSLYRFGCSSEGTESPLVAHHGSEAETDIVHSIESTPIIDDISQAPSGRSFLMIDSDARPGYVRLQVVENGTPVSIRNSRNRNDDYHKYDSAGRLCRKHIDVSEVVTIGCCRERERTDPADTDDGHETAYRSRAFPSLAKEKLQECLNSGWLTRNDVNKMIRCGCLLVGVGHPSSAEEDIEWRVSFSLQDRYIMFSLTDTQHKCYVVLKLVLDVLTSQADVVGKPITYYHGKTCLFRVIMKTSADQWTPSNLIACTLMCLAELRQCLHDGNLPNFFIKTYNMFEQRVMQEPEKERLIYHLSAIINEGIVVHLHYTNTGEAPIHHMGPYSTNNKDVGIEIYKMNMSAAITVASKVDMIYSHMSRLTKSKVSLYLFQQLRYLASVDTINEHTEEETREAITYLELILHRIYAQHLASLAFSTEEHKSRQHLLQSSAQNLQKALTFDLMSGRLIEATVLYRQGNMEMCCDLLRGLEQKLTEEIINVCGCSAVDDIEKSHTVQVVDRIVCGNTDMRDIMESNAAACTIFLPSHIEIIPEALQYEIYRSSATRSESKTTSKTLGLLCAVDSKVYLYFLQYLVYAKQNKVSAKQIAIDNLWKLLQKDEYLCHKETGYNLLGWIYSQEGHIQAAVYCFMQSWGIRPHHNAAKWHMINLAYQKFVAKHRVP